MAIKVEGSIVVQAPVSEVYTRWTQFEEFPRFMGGVTSVRFLTDTRHAWVAAPEVIRQQWETEVLELVPDEKVAWGGVGGGSHSGTVTLHEAQEGHTQVHLVCEYERDQQEDTSEGGAQVVSNSAQKDLQRFKELVETGDEEAAGLAGTIEGGLEESPG